MNKKAWLRIMEAFLAVLIVMSFMIITLSKENKKEDISEAVYEKQRYILEIISRDENLRSEIIGWSSGSDIPMTKELIKKTIPNSWNFTVSICKVDKICNIGTPNDKDIYVSETIITANLTNYPEESSRKVMFFVWKK